MRLGLCGLLLESSSLEVLTRQLLLDPPELLLDPPALLLNADELLLDPPALKASTLGFQYDIVA